MADRSRSLDETSVSMRSFRQKDDCEHETPVVVRKVKRTRRLPQRTKKMHFVSTHHHSTFSFLDGFQLPSAHVRRASEIGMTALALTEHGNVSSHVQLEGAAIKEGIKPLFGVELYCGALDPEHRSQRKNHLTILAEDLEGYRNMLRLVTKTYSEGFYYEPTADDAMLEEHMDGLVVLSGCLGSALATALVGGKHIAPEDASYTRGKRVARRFKRMLGDQYYLEVQAFPELDKTRQLNPMIARISEELKIPLVVTFDCHYTVPEENEIQQILHNVRDGSKQTLEEQARNWGYDVNLCPPWNDNMIMRKLMATGLTKEQSMRAILSAEEIGERCNVELPKLPMVRYPLRRGQTNIDVWREELQAGWRYRNLHRLPPRERRMYRDRLKVEMELIESKDFVDYFLVVGDAIRWAKDHDIAVGPARGSAAGSLACWLLRITEINPVPYPDLIFERFIDITREDLPDIDLDFDSERRGEVRNYLVTKYGPQCVGNVANFTGYKGKNALDDVARVFRVPKWEIDKIKDVLIERSSGDLRSSATIEDTVEQFDVAREVFEKNGDLAYALDLEGNYKGLGVHAAGLVVSSGPLTEVAATYQRIVKGETLQVISMDKYDAEKKGLLKLDFLGLSNMTMLNKCRLEMGWSLDDLYNLNLEDEDVIEGFKRNDIIGIFQFEGRAMRYVNGALKPDNFKEVCDVNALARPGPLHNGSANEYIDIKMGRKRPEVLHPALADITQRTYFQVVYQEQILRIMGEIFNFDWTHRAEIRRIISRKIGEQEFNRRWERAREGAKVLHPDMPEELAKAIWGLCITAGSYAFNASHCVAYGTVAAHTMWFKQHEPELFYAETLNISSKDRQQVILRDAVRHGIDVAPPDPVTSRKGWTRGEIEVGEQPYIQAGLSQIPGIADKTASQIEAYKAEKPGTIESWEDLIAIKGIGPKTVEKIREFCDDEDPWGAFWLDQAIAAVKKELSEGKLEAPDRKGDWITLPEPTHVAADLPYTRGKDIPVVWLGTIQTRNVRDMFEWNRAKTGIELKPEEVKDPHLNEWMVMVGDDESDQMGIRVDRYKYPKFRKVLWEMRPGHDLLLVRGVKPGWMPTRQVTVWDCWVIEP